MAKKARALAEAGLTDVEIAGELGVATSTLYLWKKIRPGFSEALKLGKEIPDQRVEASLYHRALGYSHPEEKIFMPAGATQPVRVETTKHYPPDTTAAIFWLKNRKPDAWRDRQEYTLEIAPESASLSELAGFAGRAVNGKAPGAAAHTDSE